MSNGFGYHSRSNSSHSSNGGALSVSHLIQLHQNGGGAFAAGLPLDDPARVVIQVTRGNGRWRRERAKRQKVKVAGAVSVDR